MRPPEAERRTAGALVNAHRDRRLGSPGGALYSQRTFFR